MPFHKVRTRGHIVHNDVTYYNGDVIEVSAEEALELIRVGEIDPKPSMEGESSSTPHKRHEKEYEKVTKEKAALEEEQEKAEQERARLKVEQDKLKGEKGENRDRLRPDSDKPVDLGKPTEKPFDLDKPTEKHFDLDKPAEPIKPTPFGEPKK